MSKALRSPCCGRAVWRGQRDGTGHPYGEQWGDAAWRRLHGMCSWCGQPVPLLGAQLELFPIQGPTRLQRVARNPLDRHEEIEDRRP